MGALGSGFKQMVEDIHQAKEGRRKRVDEVRSGTRTWLSQAASDQRRSGQEMRRNLSRFMGEIHSFVRDHRCRTLGEMAEFGKNLTEMRQAWSSLLGPSTTPSRGAPSGSKTPSPTQPEPAEKKGRKKESKETPKPQEPQEPQDRNDEY